MISIKSAKSIRITLVRGFISHTCRLRQKNRLLYNSFKKLMLIDIQRINPKSWIQILIENLFYFEIIFKILMRNFTNLFGKSPQTLRS